MLPYFDEASSTVCFVSTEYLRSLLSDDVNAISFELGDQSNAKLQRVDVGDLLRLARLRRPRRCRSLRGRFDRR